MILLLIWRSLVAWYILHGHLLYMVMLRGEFGQGPDQKVADYYTWAMQTIKNPFPKRNMIPHHQQISASRRRIATSGGSRSYSLHGIHDLKESGSPWSSGTASRGHFSCKGYLMASQALTKILYTSSTACFAPALHNDVHIGPI